MPLVPAHGAHLFYDLAGPPGAPVVVFSNSIGTTLEMWEPQRRALQGRYRILRYDTRGHGRSPVANGLSDAPPVTIDTLAQDLASLLDALGITRAHIVGLSLGGMVAQAFAATWPHRVHGLVLMATAAHLPGGWTERAALVRRSGMAAIADAVMTRWFTPAFQHQPAALELRERFLAQNPAGYALCCEAIGAMDLRPRLAAITAPTLIIAGADDPATPVPLAEDIRTRIPGAQMLVLPYAAHILNLEQPGRVNRHLETFLDDLAPTGAPTGPAAFEHGLINREAVLGAAHVARSLAGSGAGSRAGAFAAPWQDFITRIAWGEVWGDPTIPWKTRSMVTLVLMVALNREEEFKLHIRPALNNGVTLPELRALLTHCAVYAGIPAGNGAHRWVRETLGEEADQI